MSYAIPYALGTAPAGTEQERIRAENRRATLVTVTMVTGGLAAVGALWYLHYKLWKSGPEGQAISVGLSAASSFL